MDLTHYTLRPFFERLSISKGISDEARGVDASE
jgi:hypothetical protein